MIVKPQQMDIEVSGACNLKCVGCPVVGSENHGFMDFDLFTSIIDRCVKEWPDVWIVPWLIGEPLLHPRYADMLKYLDNSGFQHYVTTNGTIWRDDVFEYVTDKNNCYQIIFSLDGIPDQRSRSIEICRPGSDRDRIISNIERFGHLKMRKGNNVDMAVKIVERGQDYGEIEEYISYWLKKPYIDYVCRGRMLANHSTGGTRLYPCQYSDNKFMVIKWDGRCVYCGYCGPTNNDKTMAYDVVDKTRTLTEIYNGPKITEFRENQRKGVWMDVCKECGYAYTGVGMDGVTRLQDPELDVGKIYTRSDYYNTFYSLKKKKRKPLGYYLSGARRNK